MHSSYWGRKKIFQTYSLSFIEEKWYNLHICHEIWAQSYWEQLQGGKGINLEHLVGFWILYLPSIICMKQLRTWRTEWIAGRITAWMVGRGTPGCWVVSGAGSCHRRGVSTGCENVFCAQFFREMALSIVSLTMGRLHQEIFGSVINFTWKQSSPRFCAHFWPRNGSFCSLMLWLCAAFEAKLCSWPFKFEVLSPVAEYNTPFSK